VEEVQACQRAKMRVVKVDANTQFISQLGRGRGMQTMEMNGMKDVDTGVIERHILSYYRCLVQLG